MTVSSSTNKNTYNGDGSDTTFDFTFAILDETHLTVQTKSSAGVITTKTITTHYTVSGSGNTSGNTDYTSGTVTFVTAPLSTDEVIIKRNMPLQQNTDYTENGVFPAESHEQALDELTMTDQQQQEELDRTIKIDSAVSGFDGTLPTPVADKYIVVDSAGTGLALAADSSIIGSIDDYTDGTFYVGDGTTVVAETGNTARTSLGLGTDDSPTFNDILTVTGNAAGAAILRLYEDTDNGTNYTDIQASAAVTSNRTLTLPDASGTIMLNLVDDATPQLGANLDTNANDILFDDSKGIRDENSNEQILFQTTASAVNYLEVTNAATGNSPSLTPNGSDSNVGLTIDTIGTGTLALGSADTVLTLDGSGISGTAVKDEDDMSSDSATHLASQQSIKAYSDSGTQTMTNKTLTTPVIAVIHDANGNETLDLGSAASAVNNIKITNASTGNKAAIEAIGDDANVGMLIDTKGTGTLAVGSSDSVITLDGSSISGTAIKDEDNMSSDSATHLATQQSIKAYVDTQITAEDLDITTDSGTIAIDLDSETLTIAGGTGIDSSAATNTVTLAIDSTVTTLTGTQTLTNKTLTTPKIATVHDTNGNEILATGVDANAVNHVEIQNAATGNGPRILPAGSDANVELFLTYKGGSRVYVPGNFEVEGGGVEVGAPTGGNKGSGTINAQAVYDDNTLLTCYVFDQAVEGSISNDKWDAKVPNRRIVERDDATGTAEDKGEEVRQHNEMRKFKERIGTQYDPMDIDKYSQHWKDKKHLTAMPNEDKFDATANPMSQGEWIQRLIETVETQAIHIDNLNTRLKTLEGK